VDVHEEQFCFNTGQRDDMRLDNGDPFLYEVPSLDPLGIFPEYGFREVPEQPQLELVEASYAFPELLAWCMGDSSGCRHVELLEASDNRRQVTLWFTDNVGQSTHSSPSCPIRRVAPGESIELLTKEEARRRQSATF